MQSATAPTLAQAYAASTAEHRPVRVRALQPEWSIRFLHPIRPYHGGLRNWVPAHSPSVSVSRVTCQFRRLDGVVADRIPRPDVVKIDAEGPELLVCEGAYTILARSDAPVIVMEACARSAAAFGIGQYAALDFLRSLSELAWRFHHTGDMWTALDTAHRCVRPGGVLFIALYNDIGSESERWPVRLRSDTVLYRRSFKLLMPCWRCSRTKSGTSAVPWFGSAPKNTSGCGPVMTPSAA
jgi:hypothetical protein